MSATVVRPVFRTRPGLRRRPARRTALRLLVLLLVGVGVLVVWAAVTVWRRFHPPARPRDVVLRTITVPVTRSCAHCGDPMPKPHPAAVYCSHRCRQAAYRERRAA